MQKPLLGRKPLPVADRKSEFIGLKLTIADRDAIYAAAKASGICASQLVRDGALREARRLMRR